ncbi:hypothetical protein BGX27_005618 [Mortierella sp. AM989]|nr:hypothetical protein BGX27_005618 [Mortierella sp. AM989]
MSISMLSWKLHYFCQCPIDPTEIMIPSKRSSPFVRARSFQSGQVRSRQGSDAAEGPSPSKRPSFARTMSSPFQVLSPSLKNTKNPFEKLSQPPGSEPSISFLVESASPMVNLEDSEDEALDPNQTLRMFSLSQSAAANLSEVAETLEDSGDEELCEELDQESAHMTALNLSDLVNKDTLSQNLGKPRLHDALAMSAAQKTLRSTQELLEIKFERLPNTARKTTVHNFSSKNDLENFEDDDTESM